MPCTWWTLDIQRVKVLLGCSPGLTAVERPLTLVWRTERVKKSNDKPRPNKSTKVEVVYSRGRSSEYKVQFHFIQVHSCCSAYTPYLPEVLQRGSLWEWLGRTQGKVEGDGHDVIHEKQGKERTWRGITRDWEQIYMVTHVITLTNS